jgi:hypothetical protein
MKKFVAGINVQGEQMKYDNKHEYRYQKIGNRKDLCHQIRRTRVGSNSVMNYYGPMKNPSKCEILLFGVVGSTFSHLHSTLWKPTTTNPWAQ